MIAFGKKFFLSQSVKFICNGVCHNDVQCTLQIFFDFGNQSASHILDTGSQILLDDFLKDELDAFLDPLQNSFRQALFELVPGFFVLRRVSQIGKCRQNFRQYGIIIRFIRIYAGVLIFMDALFSKLIRDVLFIIWQFRDVAYIRVPCNGHIAGVRHWYQSGRWKSVL